MAVAERWPLQRGGRCREVNVWTVGQKIGRCREVVVTGGSTVYIIQPLNLLGLSMSIKIIQICLGIILSSHH